MVHQLARAGRFGTLAGSDAEGELSAKTTNDRLLVPVPNGAGQFWPWWSKMQRCPRLVRDSLHVNEMTRVGRLKFYRRLGNNATRRESCALPA